MEMDKNEFRKYAVRHRHVNSLHVDRFIAQVNTTSLSHEHDALTLWKSDSLI
jgi:hypothetical protein